MNVMILLCITVLPVPVHETASADSQYMDAAGQACPQRCPLYMGTGSALLGLNTITTRRLA